MTNPIISIIIPCYNQAQYLSETLQSVYEQTLDEWECIIVNDGSLDNTEEIALDWCRKDKRFRYLNKENGGLADTRNYGINHSIGEYILALDSDDKISEDYTLEAIHILKNDRQVKVVFSRAMMFGVLEGEWDLLPYTYRNELFIRNCIHCSGIYRRQDYNKTLGYNKNMKFGWEDYDFWLSLLNEKDKVFKLDKFHFFYRIKHVSMTTKITEELEHTLRKQIFKNHIDVYLKYFNPIEMYRDLHYYKSLAESNEYRIGQKILAPFRFFRKYFKKR